MSAASIVAAHPILRSTSQAESSKQSPSNTFIENISDSLETNIMMTFLLTIAGYDFVDLPYAKAIVQITIVIYVLKSN